MTLIAAFVVLVFVYSLVSARVERSILTAPMVFTAAGWLAVSALPQLGDQAAGQGLLRRMAEIGLVLLLFTDASRTDLGLLKRIRDLPGRLLSSGMLLTIALGAAIAALLFPELSLWEAGILGAILAPTDAGLGQVIVSSPRVPARIREALNVEAGLNDGLSVPFLLFFMAMAGDVARREQADPLRYVGEQLGLGALVGLAVGLAGGWLLGRAAQRHWATHSWRQLGVVALPLLCLLISEPAGASMFIASFVAGLAVQLGFRSVARHSVEFTEDWGQLLNLSVFFLFGMIVARAWPQFGWSHGLYAVLSLTVVRMLPVAIALLGTRLCRATVLFMGWFGPRGLASIVLGLVYLEEQTGSGQELTIQLTVILTVLCSIVAHGISATPGMALYARAVEALPPGAPEIADAPGPVRG